MQKDELHLLFLLLQTVSDIERGWILVNKDQHRQLKSLQEKGSKKEVSNGTSAIQQNLMQLMLRIIFVHL